MQSIRILSVIAGLLLFWPISASAVTVGIPVKDFGKNKKVGDVSADGTINFFIPLVGTETYGVDGGGLSSDDCRGADCGGHLIMFVKYTPEQPGVNIVSFFFQDLDLDGVNDPDGFFEALQIFDNQDNKLAGAISKNSKIVDKSETTIDHQILTLSIPEADGPFWLRLVFRAYGYIGGRNTLESMLTTIAAVPGVTPPSDVPLPPAVALFGTGVAGLGLAGLRKRRGRTSKAATS